ncbi:hypothetical protein C1645_841487 [Glomus cerebriforme]|uniref:Uncharacterized protein n=1 Tax=Glomus cerebriforme TaxID=658196 RepID=A0A397S429_9GLOM|nr:hypothetical protein C1645_841487 [Glomus cerebriforme]
MTILVSDKKLFAIVLYSAFVNNEYITPMRDIWKNPWVMGTATASAIGLVGLIISPIILTAIIHGLGFGTGGIAASSFASWFMSLHGGIIARGSLLSILQSIGAAGLGTLGVTISSGFGATIGILIGAVGGSKLATYFNEIELNEFEKQTLGNLVQIEEGIIQNNHMIIFTLMPALLYNDIMLKCFIETFMTCSSFAESNLFRMDFKKAILKSEEEIKVNNIIYNLLIDDYEESRVKYIFHDDNLIGIKQFTPRYSDGQELLEYCPTRLMGYDLNLNNYQLSNNKINLLVEVWKYINGNVVINIDINKIRDQFQDQFQKFSNNIKLDDKTWDQFQDQIQKFSDYFHSINLDDKTWDQFQDQFQKFSDYFHNIKLDDKIWNQFQDKFQKFSDNFHKDRLNDKNWDQFHDQFHKFSDYFHKIRSDHKTWNQFQDQLQKFSDYFKLDDKTWDQYQDKFQNQFQKFQDYFHKIRLN